MSKLKHFSYRLKSNKRKFKEIYNGNGFTGAAYPSSGIGSSLKQTEQLRQKLPLLFTKYKIKTIVDAPCGDFSWMQCIDLSCLEYLGVDIVDKVIENNENKYDKNNIRFSVLDIIKQAPPKADLILCRDCLVHLSNSDALKALSNFKNSNSKYLLATTFINCNKNIDLVSGRGWRPLNMEVPPFNLPRPLTIINEHCTEAEGKFADKSLGLWLLKDLP